MATCKWCGAESAEGAVTCSSCGQPLDAGEGAAFDPQAFAGAMSAKVDEQIAARMAEASGPPAASESAPPTPVAPAAPTPVPPPPPPQPQQYAPPAQPQQYAPPQQAYPPPGQQYAPPQQAYPPPGQQYIPPGYTAAPMQPPKSGLGNAIAVTILCCMPLGIVAIVYATQVDKKWAMGDYAGAQAAAKKANMWATIAAVVGILWIIISGIIGFSQGMNSSTSYYPY